MILQNMMTINILVMATSEVLSDSSSCATQKDNEAKNYSRQLQQDSESMQKCAKRLNKERHYAQILKMTQSSTTMLT